MLDNYDYREHWNNAYQNNAVEKLGWFEDDPVASVDLIEKCNLSKDALIFNAGAGATTLIALLLEKGYSNILVNDISFLALDKLKNSIDNNNNVSFIVEDLTNPTTSLNIKNGNEITGFCFTPQDGNSILSSLSITEWFLYPHSYEDKIQCLSKLFFNNI